MDVVHMLYEQVRKFFLRGINEYIYILYSAENVISGKMVQF